jgi:D-alanyl-D-alanine carboxypeptidase (penicillin-binding protein 5/6)
LVLTSVLIVVDLVHDSPASTADGSGSPFEVSGVGRLGAPGGPLSGDLWPEQGQAAYAEAGQPVIHASDHQRPAPIASVAKVMTALLVLRDHPLEPGEAGPVITLTAADVEDTAHRRSQEESVVPVATGEQLSELQALEALLIPSANNIAAVLARWDVGSVEQFVAQMNQAAPALHMVNTRYTDPSGFDDGTVSTAADQVLVVNEAMRLPVFADIVAMPSVTLPVAGTVRNTDRLLGRDGFLGVKTGSDDAAGGCFAFRAVRLIDGKAVTITGVVLGQRGHDLIDAGLSAAARLVNHLAGGAGLEAGPPRRGRV